jgi:ABC-type transport system substrate-binding protein
MILVRNSEWNRDSDPIRGNYAYADRIEITIGGTPEDYGQKIERGDLDLQIDGVQPADILRTYATDPSRQDRLISHESAALEYASLTVAAPPFDDVHVRRAVNWIVDKSAIIRLIGGNLNGTVAYHDVPNVSLGGALNDYKPFATPGDAGDVSKAMGEMKLSKYDANQDGLCDAPECDNVVALGSPDSPYAEVAQSLQQNFAKIGIDLKLELLDNRFEILDEPSNLAPMDTIAGWGSAPYDPTDIEGPVFGSAYIGPDACCNEVLLGASPEQLKEWGYPVTQVPSVDADIAECDSMQLGPARTACWIALDKKLTEELAVWIPLYQERITRVVSDRILAAPWNPLYSFVSIEQMAIAQ